MSAEPIKIVNHPNLIYQSDWQIWFTKVTDMAIHKMKTWWYSLPLFSFLDFLSHAKYQRSDEYSDNPFLKKKKIINKLTIICLCNKYFHNLKKNAYSSRQQFVCEHQWQFLLLIIHCPVKTASPSGNTLSPNSCFSNWSFFYPWSWCIIFSSCCTP